VAVGLSELNTNRKEQEVIIKPSIARNISTAMQSLAKVLIKLS